MKLHSLTTLNAIDPLPKLGAKVQPKKPESPEAIRAREVEAFERGVYNAVKAAAEETGLRNFARSFAHDGTGYIEPEPVVSFADAAEMAEGKAPASATVEQADAAFWAAASRAGKEAASQVWYAVMLRRGVPLGELRAAAIAALEALR